MSKTMLYAILFTALFGLSECDADVQEDTQDLNVSIIHVNDIHSHIVDETITLAFDGIGSVTGDIGGYGRVVSYIRELQQEETPTLSLNAGDTFQGTLYYSLFKGEADIAMLNQIQWDALELGNHEFDDGDSHLADYLSKLSLGKNKILAANIVAPTGNPLYGKWSPYTIKTYSNGAKIGIIGIDIVGKTKNSSNPSAQIQFLDEVSTAQKYINELKSKGINKIVLLTHVGLDNDKLFAPQLSGVDIIIGGDSHSLMGDFSTVGLSSNDSAYPYETVDKEGHKVCIAHAWQYNYAVGNLHVSFDKKGHVTSCKGAAALMLGDTFKHTAGSKSEVNASVKAAIMNVINTSSNLKVVTEDTATVTKMKTYSDQVETQKAVVIGTASVDLLHNRVPGQTYNGVNLPLGSDIAPIVAKGFYELSNRADACIQNGGGVRVSVPAGNITYGLAYTLLPFSNTLFEIDMYGSEIKSVLEDAVDEALFGGTDGTISTGSFPYAYGLRYDVNSSAAKGSRIANLEIKNRTTGTWSLIDSATMYVIVTNSYTAGGKDEYHTFKTVQDARGPGVDTYLDYALSFVKYVENLAAQGKSVDKLPADEHPIKSYIAPGG